MATKSIKKDNVAPGFNKEYTPIEKTFNIPVYKTWELSWSPQDCRA